MPAQRGTGSSPGAARCCYNRECRMVGHAGAGGRGFKFFLALFFLVLFYRSGEGTEASSDNQEMISPLLLWPSRHSSYWPRGGLPPFSAAARAEPLGPRGSGSFFNKTIKKYGLFYGPGRVMAACLKGGGQHPGRLPPTPRSPASPLQRRARGRRRRPRARGAPPPPSPPLRPPSSSPGGAALRRAPPSPPATAGRAAVRRSTAAAPAGRAAVRCPAAAAPVR
jgi:hypothetical protein